MPFLNTEVFSRLLEDFAAHFEIGRSKRVVLAIDQASFHTSDLLRIPSGNSFN